MRMCRVWDGEACVRFLQGSTRLGVEKAGGCLHNRYAWDEGGGRLFEVRDARDAVGARAGGVAEHEGGVARAGQQAACGDPGGPPAF